MIPTNLLQNYLGRGIGILVYGTGGTLKTNMIHQLPPPVYVVDMEGGSGALLPWTRRVKKAGEDKWTEISQETREEVFKVQDESLKEMHGDSMLPLLVKPSPRLDVVYYDNMVAQSYEYLVTDINNFNLREYSSIAVDSIHETSVQVQTFAKGDDVDDTVELNQWAGIQERSAIILRKLRNLRDKGVMVYLTCSEDIQKDYVKDPRQKKKGELPPEPFSVKGSTNLPGKLPNTLQHLLDLQFHTGSVNGRVTWCCAPEALPGGGAAWEGKDRTCRMRSRKMYPNLLKVMLWVYGDAATKEMYGVRKEHE